MPFGQRLLDLVGPVGDRVGAGSLRARIRACCAALHKESASTAAPVKFSKWHC